MIMQVKTWLIAMFCMMSIFIIACVPPEETVARPGSGTVPTPVMEEPEAIFNPEILRLLEEAQSITNYQYFYEANKMDAAGRFLEEDSYAVLVRGNTVVKSYVSPKRISNDYALDKAYFDLNQKTVVAECTSIGVTCDGLREKTFPLVYDEELPPYLPHQEAFTVPVYATKKGEELINSRETIIIEYDNIEMSLDQFSGLPMKRWVKDNTGKVIEKYSFTKLSINSVEPEDVVPEN